MGAQVGSGRALVLGAGGFLGSHMAHRLTRAGWQVTGLVRDPSAPSVAVRLGPLGRVLRLVKGDACDRGLLRSLLSDADVVFSMTGPSASAAATPPMAAGPDSVDVLLEELCRGHEEVRAVFAGSRLQYGRVRTPPVSENTPLAPIDWYGEEKARQERKGRTLTRDRGLNTCWTRLSVVYGPRQAVTGRPFGIVGRFFDMAVRGTPIPLYGGGSQKRDFAYVDDVTEVLEIAATHPEARGEVFNVGGPQPVSLASVAGIVAELTGAPMPEHVSWPTGGTRVETGDYWGDLSKASSVLGWKPATEVPEGLERTWGSR